MFSVGYTHKNSLPKRSVRSRTISDYSPFGVLLPEWSVNTEDFRYGFQGQEHDDEVSGEGNSYTAEFWQYSPRIGKRWNIDPVIKHHESPYACFANNSISFKDPFGSDTSNVMNTLKVFSGKHAFKDLITGSTTFNNFFSSFTSGNSNNHILLEFGITNEKDVKGQSDILFKGKEIREYSKGEIPSDANIGDFSIKVLLNPEITVNPNSTDQGASNQLDRTTTLNHELMVHSTTQVNFINSYYDSGTKKVDGAGLLDAVKIYYEKDGDHELLTSNKSLLYNSSSKEIVQFIKENNFNRKSGNWIFNQTGTMKKEMPYWMALEINLEFEKKKISKQ